MANCTLRKCMKPNQTLMLPPDQFAGRKREDGESVPARRGHGHRLRQGLHVGGGVPGQRVCEEEPELHRALHQGEEETRDGGPQLLRAASKRPHRNIRESIINDNL